MQYLGLGKVPLELVVSRQQELRGSEGHVFFHWLQGLDRSITSDWTKRRTSVSHRLKVRRLLFLFCAPDECLPSQITLFITSIRLTW